MIGVTVVTTVLLAATLATVGYWSHFDCKQCSELDCARMTSWYSPLLEPEADAIEYDNVMFKGALEEQNAYKGPLSKELDDAWDWLQHMGSSVVTGDVLDRVGKPRASVKFAEDQMPGGQYFVGVEVFHHVHCVNLIRQYIDRDYYMRPENKPEAFTDHGDILRKHVDHCIDMLRQALVCHGDVGIVTYSWVEEYGLYPDFSTPHKCRKIEKIMEWADKNAAIDADPRPGPDTIFLSKPPPQANASLCQWREQGSILTLE